jgi:hypothetical protein
LLYAFNIDLARRHGAGLHPSPARPFVIRHDISPSESAFKFLLFTPYLVALPMCVTSCEFITHLLEPFSGLSPVHRWPIRLDCLSGLGCGFHGALPPDDLAKVPSQL